MMFRLVISEPAERDIESAYNWWRSNRSEEQANRWYVGIQQSIRALRQTALQCPFAAESRLHPSGLRQMNFGVGRRPTHRIIFVVEERVVKIVRVRHSSQQSLRVEDLE
jgi:plasmid stabilization system protein ParE